MKAIGRGSIASFLLVLINGARYFVAFVLVVALMIAAAAPFIDVTGWETDVPVALAINPAANQISRPRSALPARG